MKYFRRVRLVDFILFLLPLIILLILIPPPKPAALTEERNASTVTAGEDIRIKIYNPSEALVDEYPLEEYIVGVVAAEMPSDFHEEALKAQAIAARTFAASRMKGLYGSSENHFGAHVCTDPGHCQAWISKEQFLKSHGNEGAWEKICRSVTETKNLVMTYDGILINPLYHSNSGGATEDIQEVWSNINEVPYLKSVYSPDDREYSQYEKESSFSWDEIKRRIKNKYPEAKLGSDPRLEIEILSYSVSGRVASIRIGSLTLSGVECRELLSLRSTNFEMRFPDKSSVVIKTKGYGHGVGMSQCGADALGRKGLDAIEILEYYYTGINVEELVE